MIVRAFAACFMLMWAQFAAAGERCAMSAPDRAWLDKSLDAWRYMHIRRLELTPPRAPTIVLFDNKCRFKNAAGSKRWRAKPHGGRIRLPDGYEVPPEVVSFAGENKRRAERFFVMALPSVWDSAGLPITGDHLLLTGVLLHEFSHTLHSGPLEPRFRAAEAMHSVPKNFNDDSLQESFQNDPAYVDAFMKELDLLDQAAEAARDSESRALARKALVMMEARQRQWFVGDAAYWKAYDDLFLTLEGLAQWVAYSWLSDQSGGRLTPHAAQHKIRGMRKWWSQEEGLALFLVVDRHVPTWMSQALARQPTLGIDLLRQAVGDATRSARSTSRGSRFACAQSTLGRADTDAGEVCNRTGRAP
jgi:hypothetical protein